MIYDQLQRQLNIAHPPKRIVSLVPSQTELLVDLGLKDRLVGVTKFCVHPKELRKEVTVVGGTKEVHFDKISDLQPDIVICNKEENTKEIVATLEPIAPVWVSDISTIEDNNEMIQLLGNLFQAQEKARAIIDDINREFENFSSFIKDKPSKKVAYLIWKNPYMAAGTDTFINSLLQLNKFQNILTETRYPEVTIAQLENASTVLLSSEPFPFGEKHISELSEKINADIRLVDGEYFSWYGSRLKAAFQYFKKLHA